MISVGHQPAHTAFLGRVLNFKRDAPHPFGIAGFLQRTHSAGYNCAAPRGDYCIWIGTTHNLADTHRLKLATLREMTGDTFYPALLTPEAIRHLNMLAGDPVDFPEAPLENPSAPYPLDPYRGVIPDEETLSTEQQGDIVRADTSNDTDPQVLDTSEEDEEFRTKSLVDMAIEACDTTSTGIHDLDNYNQVLATHSIKSARKIYSEEISNKATTEELQTCNQKDVWEYLDHTYITKNAIPSRMFLTPKSLPNGKLDRIKGRIVAGGHKQDRSLYEDKEVSSPTVALTSVLAMAALAANEGHHVMSLDHKAAYLNADMTGSPPLPRSCRNPVWDRHDVWKIREKGRKDRTSTEEGALWLRPMRSIMVKRIDFNAGINWIFQKPLRYLFVHQGARQYLRSYPRLCRRPLSHVCL
jgi:hypothetical protein